MKNKSLKLWLALGAIWLGSTLLGMPTLANSAELVTIDSKSPLLEVTIMVKAGSIHDPAGFEGLAYVTAEMLLQGSFGDLKQPISKEDLARLTQPWGRRAMPAVSVEKEVTTFTMAIPLDKLDIYMDTILRPLFHKPLFDQKELTRITKETREYISSGLRYENIEMLGLETLDSLIFQGTPYEHLIQGSMAGLTRITGKEILAFYQTHYRPENMIIGLSRSDQTLGARVLALFADLNTAAPATSVPPVMGDVRAKIALTGRQLFIVTQKGAQASGLHAGFPIDVNRTQADFWPLYVANIFFGTHRDSFSYLYQEIREKRGHNYGDYSYIEHFAERPSYMFPPFNTPRKIQYFSIWVRPIGNQYVHQIMKAITFELEQLIKNGLTEEEVKDAKNKAKTLYLNLAETLPRILSAKLDDSYYGMKNGYLDQYLQAIEAVTPAMVNAALRKYLSARNIKYLVVTSEENAQKLQADIAAETLSQGKSLAEYGFEIKEVNGDKMVSAPLEKIDLIERDAMWNAYPLGITRERIQILPVDQLFEQNGL